MGAHTVIFTTSNIFNFYFARLHVLLKFWSEVNPKNISQRPSTQNF